MLDKPRIVHTDPQLTAVIRLTIPRAGIQSAMGPAIDEVIAVAAAQGITTSGPVFSHHLRMDPDTFDFEVGVPVMTHVSPTGRVRAGKLPAAKVAQTVYHGSYDGLGSAWGEFIEWITTQGHKPADNLWERYLSGPESSPDPATWRTELNRPLTS